MAWLGTWKYRRKVTVSNTNIDSNLTHFPLLLTLGTSVGTGNTDVSSIFDELTGTDFDNFDSYSDGDLNGVGFWSGSTNFDIQGTITYDSSTKAVYHSPSATQHDIYHDIPQASSGTITVYHRREAGGATDFTFPIRIYEGATVISGIQIYSGDVYILTDDVWVDTGNDITADTWHKFEIEWREDSGNPQVRMRMDDGSYTDWDDTYNDWTTGIDNLGFRSLTSTSIDAYWDKLDVAGVYNSNATKIALTKTDGTTELYGEIEKWDNANESAIIWVSKSDLVLASGATTDVYLYYDVAQANNTTYIGQPGSTPAESVWDSNFKGVWHLGGIIGLATDSTANDNDGVFDGTLPNQIAGKVGYGQDFDVTDDDFITVTDNDTLDVGANVDFTISAWYNSSYSTAGQAVFYNYNDTSGYLMLIRDTTGYLQLTIRTDASTARSAIASASGVTDGNWHHIVASADRDSATGLKLFVDGAEVASYSTQSDPTDATGSLSNAVNEIIGADSRNTANLQLDGILDETRVSIGIARAVAWIKADKYNQTDALVAWGAEEAGTDIKSVNSILKSNIKSINSIAIADVKSVNTIE